MMFDVLIVGGGLAGLTVALNLADTHRVAVLIKRTMTDGASDRAQGGIAAVLDPADSIERHVIDTLAAGGGLCDEAATRLIIEGGPAAIEWLMEQGVPFTRDETADPGFHLTREGGHSHRRIVHVADATGHAVVAALARRACRHPNIVLFEQHYAIDLVLSREASSRGRRCHGVRALDLVAGEIVAFRARHTVLATGGAGRVYRHTTNPDTATGDGVAMAWRAGCRVSNMEFVQFHPTSLFHPHANSFLISETLRGEGGRLVLPDGTPFMSRYDERAELAPRDIVTRAINLEMTTRGIECVYLDMSHRPSAFLRQHFPTILARCLELGIDITKDPIPVVPAAHYTCGGVVTDLGGRTDLDGLYAVGETACTGLHGANRLASNSLLECLVIGRSVATSIDADSFEPQGHAVPFDLVEGRCSRGSGSFDVAERQSELRKLMWDNVGIVRTDEKLERAKCSLVMLRQEIEEDYRMIEAGEDFLTLRNLADVAMLIVDSARSRYESRGLHFSHDWQATFPKGLATVLCREPSGNAIREA